MPMMIPTTIVVAATIIAAVVVWPVPPPRTHINGVNIRTLVYGSCGLRWWFAGSVDHGIDDRFTDAGIL